MNYEPLIYKNITFRNYVSYTDLLRTQFLIRIEITSEESGVPYSTSPAIKEYLTNNVCASKFHIQIKAHAAKDFIWFTNEEDALAIVLKFNGKVI